MADPLLKRMWDRIKPPPAPPRPDWERPLWIQIWDALKPPPPVSVPPEIQRRRRRILVSAGIAVVITGIVTAAYAYIYSAPARAEAAFQQGTRLAATGDNARAVDHFSRAISIRPGWAEAYFLRGSAYRNVNQTDHAVRDIEQALRLNPNLADAHAMLGSILLGQNDLQRAVSEFSAALVIGPNENAYYQRGQVYEALGDHPKAIQDYNAAIALLPNAPYVYRARASAELNLRDRDSAERDRSLADAIEHRSNEAGSRR